MFITTIVNNEIVLLKTMFKWTVNNKSNEYYYYVKKYINIGSKIAMFTNEPQQ